MKKYSYPLALLSSGLLVVYMILELIEASTFKFALISFGIFGISLLVSLYILIVDNWRPFVIQISALAFAVGIPLLFQMKVNYYHFFDDREQLIEKLKNGELERVSGDESSPGYLTPEEYKRAVGSDLIPLTIDSENHFYLKFWVDEPFFNPNKSFEGFLYSSSGEFPAIEDIVDFSFYKKINDHWYHVSDHRIELEENCRFLCGGIISND